MIKIEIEPDSFGLKFIKKLKPCKWRYKAPLNDGRDHFGFIAQDVNEIVSPDEYTFVGKREGYLTINYYEFIGPMVKAIQELEEKVERLENEKQEIYRTNEENPSKNDCSRSRKTWWNKICSNFKD
jgi:hypothetical protein